MAGNWRYVFCDLLTDTDFAEVEVATPQFDSRIIVPGAFSATIPVPNRAVADQVRNIIPDPGSVPQPICHVMRDADIWDSYVIWTANPTLDDRGNLSVALQGATLESWLDHRLCQDATFAGVDQIEIARQLIAAAQIGDPSSVWAPVSAALGITATTGLSGVLRDRTYLTTEGAMVGQRLQELANSDDGFEYRVRVSIDPDTGLRTRQWRWGYPTLGRTGQHVFQSPGNVLSFSYPVDVTAGGTAFWARGDQAETDVTADAQPVMAGPVMADGLLNRGWPWLDYVEDFSSVTDLSTLQGYATWLSTVRAGGVRIAQASVRLGDAANGEILMPGQLGNSVQLVISNDLWPLLEGTWRVVGIGMQPKSRGSGQDVAQLIFADVPATPTGG